MPDGRKRLSRFLNVERAREPSPERPAEASLAQAERVRAVEPHPRGEGVPDVLVSGHHGEVARWRAERAFERTDRVRPDLLAGGDRGHGGA